MKRIFLLCIFSAIYCAGKANIIIELKTNFTEPKKSPQFQYAPIDFVGAMKWISVSPDRSGNTSSWTIKFDKPVLIYTNSLYESGKNALFIAEPNDHVKIESLGKRLIFSGRGAEKYKLKYELDSLLNTIKKPGNPKDYTTVSLEDYFEWDRYLNRHLALMIPLIESYKSKLSTFAYNYIKAFLVDQNIDDRSDKFMSLLTYAKKNHLEGKNVSAIYDTTYVPATEKWFLYTSAQLFGNYKPILFRLYKEYDFKRDSFPLNSGVDWRILFFNAAISRYKGLIREKFIADFLPDEIIQELGFVEPVERLLAKYYAEPGFPEYKKFIKDYEIQSRQSLNSRSAQGFTLTGMNNEHFTKDNIKGKIAVFDFWFTGCVGCVQMAPALKKVEDVFKNDTNIVFIGVSIDQDKKKWLKSIEQKKYTTGSGINLYTGGKGDEHPMIQDYAITGYPSLVIIDQRGRMIPPYLISDPRDGKESGLIELLKKQSAYFKDGPYVFYEDKNPISYAINGTRISKSGIAGNNNFSFRVNDDENRGFAVALKKSMELQPAEFRSPPKIFTLSDIEGNFQAFRKLLQANKIIDSNYNWTFGTGHLVFSGDMFDRGDQVTECLWLIYSLEEKAKAAGGYVHFILGNHEIMNLQGDHRYVQEKYKDNALLLGKTLTQLYHEDSELGRWLRTKNIMEKIGDVLFMHGGLAKEVAALGLSIEKINSIARPYYANKNIDSTDNRLVTIYQSKTSPFWYRMYYENDGDPRKPSRAYVDSVLRQFDANRMVTGHTIVADTISVHYGGKVINTDTKHAEEKSEALLIENDKYYRVNQEGKRVLLFVNDKKKVSNENKETKDKNKR